MSKTLRVLIGVFLSAFALVVASAFAIAYRFAWRVLTPPGNRVFDLPILALEFDGENITSVTLPLNDDTVLPGEYSLAFRDPTQLIRVGEVMSVQTQSVTRSVRGTTGSVPRVGDTARFNGWMFLTPQELGLRWKTVRVAGERGVLPTWFVAPKKNARNADTRHTWVIHIHGRSSSRAETLRGVIITAGMGWKNLVCSYRNDSVATPGAHGRYALGASEWGDIDDALAYAVQHGAKHIVLYGWSMGGAISLQLLVQSRFREFIRGVVLDSPALDWVDVLQHHAQISHVTRSVASLSVWMMRRGLIRSGSPSGIPFDALDARSVTSRTKTPILVLHSDDDGYVPAEPAHRLAQDAKQVHFVRYRTARHCKLWNVDPAKYERAVTGWLGQLPHGSE